MFQVSISLSPDKQTFVTGSVDKTSKLWDLREAKPKQTFFGHTADVNSVFVSIRVQSDLAIKKTLEFFF